MKTLELDLKKKVFIVDTTAPIEAIEIDDYEFLCKGSDLTEEIASELVEYWQNMANDGFIYENYKTNIPKKKTAVKSFISAVKSESFHWLENPIKHPKDYEVFPDSLSLFAEQEKLHLEAEEKTFSNPLIFVKK